MRKVVILSVLLLFAAISFGQTSRAIEDVNALMDKFDAAMTAQDLSGMASLISEEAMICGTDPSEFWTKKEFIQLWEQGSPDSAPDFKYMDDRKVYTAPGGNSAIVVTQYRIERSPNIPWRQVYHCVKTGDGWKIFFINIAFVPENEDIQTINQALD